MTQQLLTHVDEPEVVEEHTHEACFTEDGIQYCVCGTHFRKLTCDNGVWHLLKLVGRRFLPVRTGDA